MRIAMAASESNDALLPTLGDGIATDEAGRAAIIAKVAVAIRACGGNALVYACVAGMRAALGKKLVVAGVFDRAVWVIAGQDADGSDAELSRLGYASTDRRTMHSGATNYASWQYTHMCATPTTMPSNTSICSRTNATIPAWASQIQH